MAVPQYFLPRLAFRELAPAGRLSRSVLDGRGLGQVWADVESTDDLAHREVHTAGPGGAHGLVVCALGADRQLPRRLGYYPDDDSQRWTQLSDVLWIGIDTADPPTPSDLARRSRYPGHAVRLGDGHDWEVPVLRRPESGGPTLPRDMYWDADGRFRLDLKPEYAALWAETERIAELFLDPKSPRFGSIDLEDALRIGLEVLGLNYRVGPREQRVLRLVNTANWEAVLGAVIDLPTILEAVARMDEAQKKSEVPISAPPSASSTPGGGDSPERTDPAAATSGSSCE